MDVPFGREETSRIKSFPHNFKTAFLSELRQATSFSSPFSVVIGAVGGRVLQ